MSATAAAFAPAPAKPRVFATLGAALGLLRRHPAQLLVPYGAVSALLVAEALAVIALTNGERPPMAVNMALGLVTGIVGGVGGGAIVVAAATLARGGTPSLAGTLDALFRRRWPLITLAALAVIVLWVSTLPTWIVQWAMNDSSNADRLTAITLTTALWLPVSLYLEARFALAFQLFLLEGAGPADAFVRSWRAMRGNILRMVGILVMIGTVQAAITMAVLFGLFAVDRGDEQAILSASAAVSGVSGAILGALTIVAVTLYYLRLRESAP